MVCLPLENKGSIHLGNTARVGTLSMVLRRAERKLWYHADISIRLTQLLNPGCSPYFVLLEFCLDPHRVQLDSQILGVFVFS